MSHNRYEWCRLAWKVVDEIQLMDDELIPSYTHEFIISKIIALMDAKALKTESGVYWLMMLQRSQSTLKI
jgi:hypothetical protein